MMPARLPDGVTNTMPPAPFWAIAHPLGWNCATGVGVLGTDSSGATTANAYAINSIGVTVGRAVAYDSSGLPTGEYHAVAWMSNGTARDLNSLIDPSSGWVLNWALAISDTNWISGIGTYPSPDGRVNRAFLLQLPIPEPGSLSLLVAITFLAGASRWGSRRRWQANSKSLSCPAAC